MTSTKTLLPFAMVVGALVLFAANAKAQAPQQEGESDLIAPLEPLQAGVTADQLFARMITHNELRSAALRDYAVHRTYQVVDLKGKVHAEEIGRMEYRAPDKKTFVVTSESGSALVRHMALNPLIASEIEAATGKQHHDSSITPANYTLHLLGEQRIGPYHCYVARAVPRRRDKYLFEGKIWIDAQDYAIVRIEGHPAKKLSFWIERADFVREYEKINEFWLSRRDETFVQVRLYGKKVLTIDHQDYTVNGADSKYVAVGHLNGYETR
jgi:outer membrane lipoprotein-sorting protein